MTEPLTALDRAHAAAEAAPDDEALRWQVYAALAQSELFVLLECEPDDGPIRPQVFDLDECFHGAGSHRQRRSLGSRASRRPSPSR